MMDFVYAFFFPIYTIFLAYASYIIFFDTDNVSVYINTITSSSRLSPVLELSENDDSDEQHETDEQPETHEQHETDEQEDSKEELSQEQLAFEKFKKTDKYKFLMKYKLEKVDEDICDKEKNNNDIIFEYIPFMDVIAVLGYDFNNNYFSYWCNRSVPFYVLNVIAINYVNTFNRSHLFLNEVEEVNKVDKGVFIDTSNSEKKIENRYTKNHFKHRGKLYDLNVNLNKEEKKPKNINFDTFSKMFDTNETDINLRRERKKSL